MSIDVNSQTGIRCCQFINMNQEPDISKKLLHDSEHQYDPFLNPPNLMLADKHKLAMSVGTQEVAIGQSAERCPCCHHAVHKNPLPICCPDEQLSFLGVGHPLYYRLAKYFACLILLVFLSSGGIYFLINNLQCQTNCAFFFGIPIMSIQEMNQNPELKTQAFNLITCVLVMLGVLYVKPRIEEDIEDFKSRMWCPSNYTIMLQNLPKISEEELSVWVKELTDAEPVKINLSYDLTPYQEAYSKKEDIVYRLNKLKLQGEKIQLVVPYDKTKLEATETSINDLNLELEQQNKIIREFNSPEYPPVQTGTAFVTFNEAKTCREVVSKWGDSFTRSVINCIFGYIKSPYPVCRNQYVLVAMAPSPADVIWQNLSFSFIRNFVFELLAYLMMAVVILLAFKLQYYFVNIAFELKMEGKQTGRYLIVFLSLSMSGIILVLNMLLRLMIQQFCHFQKYYSYSKYHSSFANSYLLMYFINTCFTVYIVHGNWIQDSDQVLLWDIHLIMLTNAFSEPLSKLIDPTMMYRYIQRARIRYSNSSPYIQKYVHSVWQGHPMSIADNYQYIARILLITVWFTYAAPLGVVFSLVALLVNYWVDKIYLCKVNKLPETVNQTVASRILMALELLPLVYMCGTLQYTYKFGESADVFDFLAKFLNYGIVLVVMLITMVVYACFWNKKQQKERQELTYQDAQYLFTSDYDSQNPITRYKSEIQFLNKLLQSKNLDQESSQIIQTMISKLEKHQSVQQLEQTRTQIIDIRTKLANERLQWHRYNNSHSQQEMITITKVNSQDGSRLENSNKLP